MAHTNRSNRNKNAARRKLGAEKQQPLPMEEQVRRAEARAAAHKARYPKPPVYNPFAGCGSWRPTGEPESYCVRGKWVPARKGAE
jgi:hypothetical protein